MNKKVLSLVSVLTAFVMLFLSACSQVEKGKDDLSTGDSSKPKYENIEIPKITSEDTVMPTYFDISLYNVENYADIYLGKDFEFKTTYGGSEIQVPSTYKKMLSKGFKLKESDEYSEDSIVLAGKRLKTVFISEYGDIINAEFYNASNSSVELKKCKIVKFIISENKSLKKKSKYGMFFINGITNTSAITDVIEYLGAPSHFYAVSENEYYLDYFISKEDMRSGITVYIDPKEDTVKSIEISNFD